MKRNIILLGAIATVIIGFGYYTLFSSPARDTASRLEKELEDLSVEDNITGDDAEMAKQHQGLGTLEALRLMNEDLECTITSKMEDGETEMEGTYFVSARSMRGDFLTDSPDLSGQILSSIIIDQNNVFVWSEIEGELYGMKMSIPQVSNTELNTGLPVSINDQVHYDCKPWKNVDRAVFLPPENVLFRDLNDLMNTGMEYGNIYEEWFTFYFIPSKSAARRAVLLYRLT